MQPTAAGHGAPLPLGATICCHRRCAGPSHAAVHTDQWPPQSRSGATGQSPSPGEHAAVAPWAASHGRPPARAATRTEKTRSAQDSPQRPHSPTQSTAVEQLSHASGHAASSAACPAAE